MSLEFGQTKEYITNLVSRAFGVNHYQTFIQADKISKTLGWKEVTLLKETGILFSGLSFLASATFRAAEIARRIKYTDSATKPSKFFEKFALAGTLIVDIAPYALLLIGDPLFIAAKPLINAASQVVADVIEARLVQENKLPEAPNGTYNLLEQLGQDHYDPKLGGGIIRDSKGNVLATIIKESVCAIGGSCMELRVVHEDKAFDFTHITRGDRIVNIGTFGTFETRRLTRITPKVEDLVKSIT